MDNRLFTLENTPIEIIAGDTVEIPYQVLKHDGKKIDLTTPGTKIEWLLSPYENLGYTEIEKVLTIPIEGDADYADIGIPVIINELGNKENTDCFNVKLIPTDTMGKSGMYTYQIVITDPNNAVNRRMQGNILIWQNIWERR